MRIEITGDESISSQARTYAEYRVFAAVSQALDTDTVRHASLGLHRTKSGRDCDGVLCKLTVELHEGDVIRLSTYGEHPYAAINRAVERFRQTSWRARFDDSRREAVAAE